jgi:putative endonuclease
MERAAKIGRHALAQNAAKLVIWTLLLGVSDRLRHHARRRRWSGDQATGRRGEDLAHRFLQRLKFRIVARNYRPRSGPGEIDLIAWDRDTLVFVEVKTRRTDEYGSPDRAVDHEKRLALVRAAREYARRANVEWPHVRFDLVSVVMSEPPSLSHTRDAFARAEA